MFFFKSENSYKNYWWNQRYMRNDNDEIHSMESHNCVPLTKALGS